MMAQKKIKMKYLSLKSNKKKKLNKHNSCRLKSRTFIQSFCLTNRATKLGLMNFKPLKSIHLSQVKRWMSTSYGCIRTPRCLVGTQISVNYPKVTLITTALSVTYRKRKQISKLISMLKCQKKSYPRPMSIFRSLGNTKWPLIYQLVISHQNLTSGTYLG